MKRETRNISSPLEIRQSSTSEDSRHIEGYAIVFNERSVDLGGFTEIILPEAVEGVLERSDILAVLNHDPNRGVLARYRNGGGSLTLEVDDHGLKYSFEAPHTALGDELLENIRRGEISGSSFAFTVSDEVWEGNEAEGYLRTIKRFDRLFDVSPVYNPAYEQTSVDTRGLEEFRAKAQPEPDTEDEPSAEEESPAEEIPVEHQPEPDETPGEESPGTDEVREDRGPDDDEESRNTNPINSNSNPMAKPFSLLRAIAAVVDQRNFDESTEAVIREGRSIADQSNVSANGQIVIPISATQMSETRAANGIMAGEATMGSEAVATDVWNIAGALRDRSVLGQAGAHFLTLKSNIEIPVYSGSNVAWEGEVDEAKNGVGTFKSVKLSPKRLTAFVDISKLALIQMNDDIEALVRQDLIDAVTEKLQQTILGDAASTGVAPAGLFNGVSDTAVSFKDFVDVEAELEKKNVYGDYKYILNPAAKAALRATKVDEGSGRFVYESNEINGIPAFSTNSVADNGVALGVWSELIVGMFGPLDITVDPLSRAAYGQIRLVVNGFYDFAARRPEAFVKRLVTE